MSSVRTPAPEPYSLLKFYPTPDDPASHPVGPLLALLTLSPFFLFSSYATIILINRPLSGFNILLGQLGNEALNGILKRRLKGARPGKLGDGYGMPSSHSQVDILLQRTHTTMLTRSNLSSSSATARPSSSFTYCSFINENKVPDERLQSEIR